MSGFLEIPAEAVSPFQYEPRRSLYGCASQGAIHRAKVERCVMNFDPATRLKIVEALGVYSSCIIKTGNDGAKMDQIEMIRESPLFLFRFSSLMKEQFGVLGVGWIMLRSVPTTFDSGWRSAIIKSLVYRSLRILKLNTNRTQ